MSLAVPITVICRCGIWFWVWNVVSEYGVAELRRFYQLTQWYAALPELRLVGRVRVEWDLEQPFIYAIKVQPDDIDELGHANNAVYVRWLEECAWQHSQSLGLGLPEYQQLNRAMVVMRHEIDYLAAAYLGEELELATWIASWDSRLRMTRHFQLRRPSDGCTLLRADTTFACVELSSGKPRRMPKEFIELYGEALIS